MKKKIVIKAQMNCDKCRTKAMKSIASFEGVASVAIDAKDKDHLVVSGDNVDCIEITKTLRRKLGYAEIVAVDELKDVKKEVKNDKAEEKAQWNPINYFQEPQVVIYQRGYNANPDPCCIL